MKIDCKDYRAREGDKVHLAKWPTKVDPVYKSKEQYETLLEEHVAKLSAMQHLHYASDRHAILLILQATDAAGKGRRDPSCDVGRQPSGLPGLRLQAAHGSRTGARLSLRTSRDLPERGRIAIFNRSYYEEVLVVRVHPDILHQEAIPDAPHHDAKVWRERYRSINDLKSTSPSTGLASSKSFSTCRRKNSANAFRTYRRPREELEIQRRGFEGAQILGRLRGSL